MDKIKQITKDGIIYTIEEGKARVGKQSCTLSGAIKIPSKVDGYSVTSIEKYAFQGCSNLTSVEFPDSINEIGIGAFYDCKGINELKVDPNNSVYESNSNCIIEKSTKKLIIGCKKSIIPIDVISIGAAFYGCADLTRIYIPIGVENISGSTFYGCNSLESIEVNPNNTIYESKGNCIIEQETNTLVAGCKNSIIPQVTSIGDFAFSGHSGLTKIEIPNSVIKIGKVAFDKCSSLTSVKIHSGVTSIEALAFNGCSSLTKVIIPKSVTNIGPMAFCFCSNELKIYCEIESKPSGWDVDWTSNGTTIIWGYNSNGYEHTEKYNNILRSGDFEYKLNSNGNACIMGYLGFDENVIIPATLDNKAVYDLAPLAFHFKDIKNVDIENGLTRILVHAFGNCANLRSVKIPISVKKIYDDVFNACDNVTIYCEASSKPEGWDDKWNSDRPIVWGYKGD